MINKLTGEPVSAEMQNVLKRLAANESVPESEINALKEIKEANSCISASKPTIELKNRTGIQLGVYNRLQNMGSAVTKEDGTISFSGEIHHEKRLDIVIGLPASGKSSAVVEPISELYKSRVIDSDEAKYVHFNELDRNKALGRLMSRFLETGRYIKPELVTKYGGSIHETYETLKSRTDLISGYSKWSNDVPLGCRPKLLEYSESCEDMVRTFKAAPTLRERAQQSESSCKVLLTKIIEVNDVFRRNPELSREYVKKRDELRAQKGIGVPVKKNPPKRPNH